jgi:Synergist-CTERM protein sorting domain-containing protein
VTDGGAFDLEPASGIVTFRVCSVRAAETAENPGSGGGCNASGGFAPLALLLLLPLWAFARSKGSIGK